MQKHQRQILSAVERILEPHSVMATWVQGAGDHDYISVGEILDPLGRISLSRRPGDVGESIRIARAEARRILRDAGLTLHLEDPSPSSDHAEPPPEASAQETTAMPADGSTISRPAYRKLTTMETVAIHTRLSQVLHPHPDQPGCYYYADDHSDEGVALEVIPSYPGDGPDCVGRIRRECFGNLPRTSRAPGDPDARIARLEHAIERLCRMLGVDAREVLA